MKNYLLRQKVSDIFFKIDRDNEKFRNHKRYQTMTTYNGGKLIEYGVYDYKTKKYVLHNCYSLHADRNLQEIEEFYGK